MTGRLPAPGTRAWTCRCSGTELRRIAHETYPSRPWRNGQGISRDIASGEGWQASLAEIDRSGRFSDFTGSLRLFAVVAGAVVLHLPRGHPIACDAASPVVVFDGGEPPDCEVVASPARALNLIVPAGSGAACLERLVLEPGSKVLAGSGDEGDHDGGVTLIFVQSGRVECRLCREADEPGRIGAAGAPEAPAEPPGRSGTSEKKAVAILAGAADSVIVTGTGGGERLLLRAADRQRAAALVARIGAGVAGRITPSPNRP